MAAAAGLYQERLLKQNMLDFDDMTLWSIVVVHEHEEMREKHQQQFGHLRVDETATTCSWWVTPTGPFDGARRIGLDTTYRSTKNILEGGERAHPAGERAHPAEGRRASAARRADSGPSRGRRRAPAGFAAPPRRRTPGAPDGRDSAA